MKKLLLATLLTLGIWLKFSLADDWTLINTLAEWTQVWQSTAVTVIKDNWLDWTNEFRGWIITNTILFIAMTYIVPLLVVVWVIVAIVGLWWVITSTDAKSTQKWMSYILWWVAWIVIMFSAVFITSNITWVLAGDVWRKPDNINWIINSFFWVLYPFVKLLFYIIPWILFLILLFNAFQYVTAQNDDAVKKSTSTMLWSITGIIVILWASFMVNSIYWKWGQQPLTNTNLSFVYKVLNWILSFIFLAMVLILIYQAYLIIAKPDDAARYDKIRKSMIYMFLGIVLIGGAYLLVNFAIIKPEIPTT